MGCLIVRRLALGIHFRLKIASFLQKVRLAIQGKDTDTFKPYTFTKTGT
jgi:hypothetical protein